MKLLKNNKVNYEVRESTLGGAFTLVELIVVITILAILGTIAFISLQGYSRDARDSIRLSDVNSIESSLTLFETERGIYPDPTGGVDVTFSGGVVWTQGTIGEGVIKNLDQISKKPIDPLTEAEYVYSRLNSKKEFEVFSIMEGDTISLNNELIPGAYAATSETTTAFIVGDYNGAIAKVNTGSVTYVLAVPTIINGDISSSDLVQIIQNGRLVYNGYTNLPSNYGSDKYKIDGETNLNLVNVNNIVVYTGSINDLSNNLEKQLVLLNNLKTSYSGTDTVNDGIIKDLLVGTVETTNPTNEIKSLAGNVINTALKTNIDTNKTYNTPYYAFRKISSDDGNTPQILDMKYFNGSAYITGKYTGNFNLLGKEITDSGSGSTFIAKINNNGWADWVKTSGGNTADYGGYIYINSKGNIYISGTYTGDTSLFGVSVVGLATDDMYIAKFDSNGNNIWLKTGGGVSTYNRINGGLVANSAGDVYAFGAFKGTSNIFGQNLTSIGQDDWFLVKLDTNGNNIWSKQVGSTSYEQMTTRLVNLAIDKNGYLYMGASFGGSLDLLGISVTKGVSSQDSLMAKVDPNGNAIWTKQVSGSSDWGETIFNITVDDNLNVYVVGKFEGTADIFGVSLTSLGKADVFLSKLDSEGNNIWSKKAGTNDSFMAFDHGVNIDVNSAGEIYIIGDFYSGVPADVFGISITLSQWGQVLARLDSNGNAVWVKDFSYNYTYYSNSEVLLDENGEIYTFGSNTWGGVYFISKLNSNGVVPN